MSSKYVWTLLFKVADGHRYFREENSGRYAMSSASNPERSEDGILWFDVTRPLAIDLKGTWFAIPISSERNKSHGVSVAGESLKAIGEVLVLWQDAGGRIEVDPDTQKILEGILQATTRQRMADLAVRLKKDPGEDT